MRQLVDDLQGTIVAAFETEEYRARQRELQEELAAKQEEVLEDLRSQAATKGLAIIRTPAGVAAAPMKDGEVVDLGHVQESVGGGADQNPGGDR